MSVLDKVLTLRPTSVVARLGPGSRLPLLDPRELLRAIQGVPAALPCLPIPARACLPGLLAAARGEDAFLGLMCPHPLADRGAAERFVSWVLAVAEAEGHTGPLFLQAGPVRLSRTDAEPLEEGLYRLVEAGFSLVSLEVSRLPVAEAVEAVRRLAAPVLERELSLEVTPPAGADGQEGMLDEARALLEGLRREGVTARFLRLPAGPLGGEEPDVERLRTLVELAGEFGTSVAVGDGAGDSARALPTYVAAGVRKVECAAPFERLALAVYPAEVRAGVEQKAQRAGLPPGELLGILGDSLAPREQERLEALSFAEALEVLAALGATGMGWKSMRFLAQKRDD